MAACLRGLREDEAWLTETIGKILQSFGDAVEGQFGLLRVRLERLEGLDERNLKHEMLVQSDVAATSLAASGSKSAVNTKRRREAINMRNFVSK